MKSGPDVIAKIRQNVMAIFWQNTTHFYLQWWNFCAVQNASLNAMKQYVGMSRISFKHKQHQRVAEINIHTAVSWLC